MDDTFSLDTWESPATRYPRGKTGNAEVKGRYYKKGIYEAYKTGPDGEEYTYFQIKQRVVITALKVGGKVVMVDDPPHYWAMQDHAKCYRGTVLVAGLGLGLIVHELHKNRAVTQITVVERETSVIELIGPCVPNKKLRIVNADWYEYEPDFSPDGVFYDLLVGRGRELRYRAVRETMELRLRFPKTKVFRIHGFANDKLNAFGDQWVHLHEAKLNER